MRSLQLFHCKFDCSYKHAHKRVDDWKLYETKIYLIVDWIKFNDFNSIQSNDTRDYNHNNHYNNRDNNEEYREDDDNKTKRVKFDFFTSSTSTISSSIIILNKRTFNDRRVHRFHKDFNFWLNNDVDNHMCYDKNLFHDLRLLTIMKIVEIVIDDIVVVEKIKFILFQFKINEQKIINIVIDVKYVFELKYNFISIDFLESKNCEIVTKKNRMIVIDFDDDHIFMIDTRQHAFEKNLYILNFWKSSIVKSIKSFVTWMQWHHRFDHFNMNDVRNLAIMSHFDDSKCFKLNEFEANFKCETCILIKMHKTFNHDLVRVTKRASRKRQRFHIDLVEDDNIMQTFNDKRYVVIFIDDFIDYIWIYLIKRKSEFNDVLKKFVIMIEIQNHRIKTFRCDNVKENINDVINAFLKKKSIQWKRIVSNNSHQNDVIERVFRIIFNRVRVYLIDFKLSRYLWEETCHIVMNFKNINFCILLSFEKKTLYEIWKSSKSKLIYFYLFETLCYSNKEKIKTLKDQKIKCQLLNYEISNQYRL